MGADHSGSELNGRGVASACGFDSDGNVTAPQLTSFEDSKTAAIGAKIKAARESVERCEELLVRVQQLARVVCERLENAERETVD